MELIDAPAIEDDDPLDIVAEGAGPRPGVWPEVANPTPPERMTAHPGNGIDMRASFLRRGLARSKPELEWALAEAAPAPRTVAG